jgi:hypothetical protein
LVIINVDPQISAHFDEFCSNLEESCVCKCLLWNGALTVIRLLLIPVSRASSNFN